MLRRASSANVYCVYLVRLLAAACVIVAECACAATLGEAQLLESSRPLAEGNDGRIHASIDRVILRNAPDAWVRDAEWDEYLIRIRALSDEPVEIREVTIFDAFDHRIAPRADRGELVDGTREIEHRYKQSGELVRGRGSNGWVTVGVILVAAGVAMAVGSGPSNGFLAGGSAPAAGLALAGGLLLADAGAASLVNNAKVNREIQLRTTTLPVALPRGMETSVDLFFPLTPQSRRTQIVYADRHGEHRLDIDTRQALKELELEVDPPPTVASRPDLKFPDLARRQGIDRGYVIANLTLDRHGYVIGIDVIESVPPGAFTNEARKNFKLWTFNEGRHDSRMVEAKLEFKR